MTNRNKVRICAITGEAAPEVGSTAVAILKPDEEAIFSPAKEAAPKIIVSINPAERPIAISVNAATTPANDVIKSIFGKLGFNETTISTKVKLIEILTGRLTKRAPNSGEANKNDPILRLANRNCAQISKRV